MSTRSFRGFVKYSQCSQASSPSVFRLGRDGRQIGDLCPGRTPGWQSVLIYAQDGRPGPIDVLVYVSFLNLMSIRSVLWRSEDFFYSNVEKIRLYYHVSNFAINQPMLPVISDPGLYLCIFCSLRLRVERPQSWWAMGYAIWMTIEPRK